MTFFPFLAAALWVAFIAGTIRQAQDFEGGDLYRPVFEGMPHGIPKRITPADFDGTDWIDSDGYLKPGTPLKEDGTVADGLDSSGSSTAETAAYVVPYSVSIAESGSSADLTAAPDGDISVATRGDLVQKQVEEGLGRALTSDEEASITRSGRFTLI